jgi:polysaccharide biosynthesis protein PslH
MRRFVRSVLNSIGKGSRPVAAVFGFTPSACHQAVSYLCQQQPGIPIWLFSMVQPLSETRALCERVEVRRNAAALLLHAEKALWPRWVVLCAGTWTGERGKWILKLSPFAIPPFRVLLLNGNGDFMPGRPRHVLLHWRRAVQNRAKDLASANRDLWPSLWRSGPCTRAKDIVGAVALLVLATVLRWLRYPQRAVFHRWHGVERLAVPHSDEEDLVLWRSEGGWDASPDSSFDDMLPLFDDQQTFAVSRQSDVRGWKPVLFATAPFRQLQPGEATRVLAPLSGTILVSRKKLALLGAPDGKLTTTDWLLLFWKAAAAGWLSYAVGQDEEVSAEPEFPVHETAFVLSVLSNKALRALGPCEPQLSRGNIAFAVGLDVVCNPSKDRLRVLVVSPFLPYPLSHGGAVRIFNLCRALSDRVDFGLIAIREAGDVVDYAKLHNVFRNVWIADLDERESSDLRLPGQVRRYESPSLRALVVDLCQNWKPDLLQIEQTHLAGLRENTMDVPAILVEHDLTLGLYGQFAEHEPSSAAEQEYRRWLAFERKWLSAYEGVWAMCEEERQGALTHGSRRGDRTFTIPNGVDTFRFRPSDKPVSRPEVLFVGSFRHWPNILAFENLCTEIMPRVWERFPDAKLRVVAGPSHERFRQMLRPAAVPGSTLDHRVDVLGFVEDLRPLYARAAVVVAPLAISSGTNIKVLEAMACAKAIVSTPAGCSGLGLRDGDDAFIREDWNEFSRTVCALLCDSLRFELGRSARGTAEQRFCWDRVADRAYQSYLAVLGRGEHVMEEQGVRLVRK